MERTEEFYKVVLNEERYFPSLAFTLSTDRDSHEPVLVITQRQLAKHPPFGLVSHVHITIKGRKYLVNVLMRTWDSGKLDSLHSIHSLCSKFADNAEYKFCPGLDPEVYQKEYFEKIRYHIESVRQTNSPFIRVDSVNCAMWFLLAPNATAVEKKSKEVKCPACKRLVNDLNCQQRRTLKESPTRKLKRQAASSHAKMSCMSPASQQKRKLNAKVARSSDKLKLAKYQVADRIS